jgi:hypothetical protein
MKKKSASVTTAKRTRKRATVNPDANGDLFETESQADRRLTHKLEYHRKADRWRCECGYELGTGHAKLYATCPLALRKNKLSRNQDK